MKTETTYKLPIGFKTSIEVLKEVLNMPVSTIEYELKKNKYPAYSSSSNCIDEKMLDIFAEKHCRKLKRFFENCVHSSETLSYENLSQFYEFSKAYSKFGRITRNWRHINKVAIKDDFFRQIVELTARKNEKGKQDIEDCLEGIYVTLIESVISRCDNFSLRVFDVADSIFNYRKKNYYLYDVDYRYSAKEEICSHEDNLPSLSYPHLDSYYKRVILVGKIKQSWLYRKRLSHHHRTNRFVSVFTWIYLCARFHIVADDGKDVFCLANSIRV